MWLRFVRLFGQIHYILKAKTLHKLIYVSFDEEKPVTAWEIFQIW